jgi:CheY-like chemotaxis protein
VNNVFNVGGTPGRPSLSFVVPLKDEQATLEDLFRGIAAQARNMTSCWEVIFVDDGSSDGSWNIIRQLATDHPEHVKALRFRRNVGKADALAAGWKQAKGDFVFTLDADLQDDPEEIPRFLDKMEAGFDVVTGWKRTRHDPWHKVLPSRVFNLLLSHVNGVHLHDHNCGFKCYRREVVQALPMYGEMHRMVPSLAAIQGFRTAEIPVKHPPRRYDRSKYGLKRFVRGFLDMWTVHFLRNFRQRPMHLMGGVSLLMLATGPILALLLAGVPIPLSATLLLSSALPVLLVGSILIMMIGLIAEWNVHQGVEHAQEKPIAETIGLVGLSTVGPFPSDHGIAGSGSSPLLPSVLVLDDDPDSRELTATHMRDAGWRVLTAKSCEEARWKVNARLDVVLLDVDVQDDSGMALVEFIRLVRRASPPPEIIFLPSETRVKAAVETMRIGAFDYLCKPVEPAQLVNVAFRALNQGRQTVLAADA